MRVVFTNCLKLLQLVNESHLLFKVGFEFYYNV